MSHRIWRGRVHHRRLTPVPHAFSYRLFLVGVDLDRIQEGFQGRWFWSSLRPALFWLRREDHFGDPDRPLADCVRDLVQEKLGFRPLGRLELLTQPRTFGYVMNPVSFFHCFDGPTGRLAAVIAEIHNTPWGERHLQVLDQRESPEPKGGRVHDYGESALPESHRFLKEFHVSPFMPMDLSYAWRFMRAGRRATVVMENWREGTKLFEAHLSLERSRFGGREAARALIIHPFQTLRVGLAIYWQALRLWLKGAPVFAHQNQKSSSSRASA